MAYDSKVKNKAFKLFCLGKSILEISKAKGMPSEGVLYQWKRNDGWDSKRNNVNNKTNEKLAENISDYKAKMILELCDLKTKIISEVDKCLNPTKEKVVDSIIKLQQQELLLRGEVTEHKKIEGDIVNRNYDFSNLTTEEIRELLKNED